MAADIRIREARADDGEAFGQLRWAMMTENHPERTATEAMSQAYYAEFARYVRVGIASGGTRGWLAEQEGQPVASAILLIWQMPPAMNDPIRKRGYVTSVYVAPEVRRQGIARAMMERLITAAREEGCHRLILSASDMGRAVYDGLGFTSAERSMELELR